MTLTPQGWSVEETAAAHAAIKKNPDLLDQLRDTRYPEEVTDILERADLPNINAGLVNPDDLYADYSTAGRARAMFHGD